MRFTYLATIIFVVVFLNSLLVCFEIVFMFSFFFRIEIDKNGIEQKIGLERKILS